MPEGTSRTFGSSVVFTSDDGVTLHGLQIGDGDVGVVLAHQIGTDGASWEPLATALADEGYMVLAFDFRSFGQSGGQFAPSDLPIDVAAASQHLASEGTIDVVLVGASMGGIASLEAAVTRDIDPAAVVTLSAPHIWQGLELTHEELRGFAAPSLFINTENDDFILSTRRMVAEVPGAEQQIYPGRAHGTELLVGDHASAIVKRIVEFLQAQAPSMASQQP